MKNWDWKPLQITQVGRFNDEIIEGTTLYTLISIAFGCYFSCFLDFWLSIFIMILHLLVLHSIKIYSYFLSWHKSVWALFNSYLLRKVFGQLKPIRKKGSF